MRQTFTLLHPALESGGFLIEAKAIEEITLGIGLLEGAAQQALGGFGVRIELPEPCPIFEVSDRVHVWACKWVVFCPLLGKLMSTYANRTSCTSFSSSQS